jgi:DNA-binding MurR/RpiR family transcriptional regulator
MRRVPTSDADGPGNLNAVADAIRQRKLILFVGGGITQSLGLPGFQELVRYLARELGYEVQKLSQADYPVIAEAFVTTC